MVVLIVTFLVLSVMRSYRYEKFIFSVKSSDFANGEVLIL